MNLENQTIKTNNKQTQILLKKNQTYIVPLKVALTQKNTKKRLTFACFLQV